MLLHVVKTHTSNPAFPTGGGASPPFVRTATSILTSNLFNRSGQGQWQVVWICDLGTSWVMRPKFGTLSTSCARLQRVFILHKRVRRVLHHHRPFHFPHSGGPATTRPRRARARAPLMREVGRSEVPTQRDRPTQSRLTETRFCLSETRNTPHCTSQ